VVVVSVPLECQQRLPTAALHAQSLGPSGNCPGLGAVLLHSVVWACLGIHSGLCEVVSGCDDVCGCSCCCKISVPHRAGSLQPACGPRNSQCMRSLGICMRLRSLHLGFEVVRIPVDLVVPSMFGC
jgi:hypothetical protein